MYLEVEEWGMGTRLGVKRCGGMANKGVASFPLLLDVGMPIESYSQLYLYEIQENQFLKIKGATKSVILVYQ